jgi:hypothetical protein
MPPANSQIRRIFTRLFPGIRLRQILGIALLFSLQILAGHTQTTFITAVALLLWLAGQMIETRNWKLSISNLQSPISSLLFGGLLALLLTAVQLLPTLELAGQSARQSGLTVNEVLSFSLHPLLLTQALLPRIGQSLFSEYVAFIPLTMLMLAVLGAWQWRQVRGVLPAVILVVIGLLLALGVFNPMNWLLARLPGFNLFRVPARWLVLYSFGISLLAGLGWQIALDRFYKYQWLFRINPDVRNPGLFQLIFITVQQQKGRERKTMQSAGRIIRNSRRSLNSAKKELKG